uniref:BZIP domain-containing protein n=1 Tax=Peronospora matthiolae TaxID=2874970 RepID=A0AAV1UV10_9STRA
MTPVSLPSLRFEPVGALNMCVPRLLPFSSEKARSAIPFDPAPVSDVIPKARDRSLSPQQPELAWRSSLTADQIAAIAIAQQETEKTLRGRSKVKPLWPPPHSLMSDMASEDWKRMRRKEQCRINQANYRKRKRYYEEEIECEMRALEQEIERLQTCHAASLLNRRQNAVQTIGDFYYAVSIEGGQQRLDGRAFWVKDGRSPALCCLLELQREEFDSVDSFKLHWLCYCKQFRVFQLSISSCERLEAGEHVIIQVTSQLRMDVDCGAQRHRSGNSPRYGSITYPVMQQFEFREDEQVITRITSEVDLVGGIAAIQNQSVPDCTLDVLRYLSEGFTAVEPLP